jgi:hypothetical protein
MADEAALAGRFGLDPDLVQELLLDDEALGWVSRVSFADLHGWALTERGYAQNQRRLGTELDQTGARAEVDAAHGLFVDLNSSFLATVTNWQIRPKPTDLLAANDHTDQRWDARVVADLHDLDHGLRPVCEQLALLCNASTGTPSGTRRLCSEWIAANDLGLHNPRSTPATPSGWNCMKISWRPSAWNAYRTGTEPSCKFRGLEVRTDVTISRMAFVAAAASVETRRSDSSRDGPSSDGFLGRFALLNLTWSTGSPAAEP